MFKLDLKDKKILYELDKDARQSHSDIAKKVRLNKNTVGYKIKRMEDEGIISGYYTVIDNSKLGYFCFRCYLKFFNTTPEIENEIVDYLVKNGLIGVVAKIETVYNLVFMMWVKNIYDFDEFWLTFKKKYRQYFWNEKVDVFTKVWHFKRKYLLEEIKKEEYEFIGSNESAKYDEIDMKILHLIVKNSKVSVITLSEQLKIPPRTIAFRIKQLEKKKIIQGYRINIDLEKIGCQYYKINMQLNNFEKYDELLSFCKNHKNIIYIDRTLSDLDFEIDVEIRDSQELITLLNEIKFNFSIRDISILNFKKYFKLELLPEKI